MEAAIRLSLAEPGKETRPKPAPSDTDDTDDEDDLLETFSSSDSDTERPKTSCPSTESNSVKNSSAAAAAAGSEAASGHNQSEDGVSHSEAGASNCVNGTTCFAAAPDVPRSQGKGRATPELDSDRSKKMLARDETDTSIGEGKQPKSGMGQGSSDNGEADYSLLLHFWPSTRFFSYY